MEAPSHAYLQQLARAYRFRDRYAASVARQSEYPDNGFNDLEDNLWAAFQNIWHVKDWIFHDPTLESSLARKVVAEAEASKPLLVASDMANGTKHCHLKNERVGAHDMAIEITDNPDRTKSVHHIIALSDGTRMRAIDALDSALRDWSRILGDNDLWFYSAAPTT